MHDRITVARLALESAAKAFREYEAHHLAKGADDKADRNRRLAEECEGAAALLVAQ